MEEVGGVEAQVRTIERWLEISDPWKESQPGVVINRMWTEETQGWPPDFWLGGW